MRAGPFVVCALRLRDSDSLLRVYATGAEVERVMRPS